MEGHDNADYPRKLEELKTSMKLIGKVTKLDLVGAFVDVGVEREGLVHISMLKRDHVNRVEDVLQEGQQVEVWVHRVDAEAGRLELTMIRPVQLKWKDIKKGMQLKGEVVRIEKFGAFIDVGATRPGLIHVSELSNDYISNPADVVNVGEEVVVRVIDLDRKKRQIRLSMKEMIPVIEDDDEAVEEVPTAMEFALRQAMQHTDQDETESQPTPHSKKEGGRKEQEDLLTRTLKHKVRTASSK